MLAQGLSCSDFDTVKALNTCSCTSDEMPVSVISLIRIYVHYSYGDPVSFFWSRTLLTVILGKQVCRNRALPSKVDTCPNSQGSRWHGIEPALAFSAACACAEKESLGGHTHTQPLPVHTWHCVCSRLPGALPVPWDPTARSSVADSKIWFQL